MPGEGRHRQVGNVDWEWSVGAASAFEFLVDDALYGERATADDWPPTYTTWTSQGLSSD